MISDYIEQLMKHTPDQSKVSNAFDSYSIQLNSDYSEKIFKLNYAENDWEGYKKFLEKFMN